MVSLNDLERMQQTRMLIQAGLRLSIVRDLTGESVKLVRTWWKEIHNTKPQNGKLKESVLGYIKNKKMAADLSAFAVYYQKAYGIGPPTAKTLITAHADFTEIFGPIDINAAYYVIRDLEHHFIVIRRCHDCYASFIYDTGSAATESCPFCNKNLRKTWDASKRALKASQSHFSTPRGSDATFAGR